MSEEYIREHFEDIKKFANVIERRIDDADCTMENVLKDNAKILDMCRKYKVNYIMIDEEYGIDVEL